MLVSIQSLRIEYSGSESSGSGGGGGVAPPKEIAVKINDKQTKVILSQGKVYTFIVGSVTHKIKLDKLYMDRATITIESEPQTATLYVGNSKEFNLDSGIIEVTLRKIKGGTAVFVIEEILTFMEEENATEIKTTQPKQQQEEAGTVTVEVEQTPKQTFLTWIIAAVVIIMGIVLIVLYNEKRIKQQEEENK